MPGIQLMNDESEQTQHKANTPSFATPQLNQPEVSVKKVIASSALPSKSAHPDATSQAPSTLTITPRPRPTWENYFSGKCGRAVKFLDELKKVKTNGGGGITIPDQTALTTLSESIVPEGKKLMRLIDLLQNDDDADSTIREIHAELMESIVRMIPQFKVPEQMQHFVGALRNWLKSKKKPLDKADFTIYWFLLIYGHRKEAFSAEVVFELTDTALAQRKNGKGSGILVEPVTVFLKTEPDAKVINCLLALACAYHPQLDELERQAVDFRKDITRLHAQLDTLQRELSETRTSHTAAENRAERLAQEVTDVRNDYRGKLDAQRGRLCGKLCGDLSSWLQSAIEAAQMEPPSVPAIRERLDDILCLIQKEIQCLQPSA